MFQQGKKRKDLGASYRQLVGKADLIAKTTEIKGRVRLLARIKERHLRNQRDQ